MLKMYAGTLSFLNTAPRLTKAELRTAVAQGDYRLVWYAVAAIVLFALAATIILGAIIYCDLKGKHFGAVQKSGTFTYLVGCW